MQFILGIIVGIAICVFIASVLAFFKTPIMSATASAIKNIENAGPRPKGYVFEPESDIEIARKKQIAKNKAEGKDTPISELI